MAYFNFASWDQAPQAKPFYLDQNPNLAGYNCAPPVFYFRPQKKWYMIFQSQQPRFSTTDNIADPMSWSAPQNFFEGTPKSVVEIGQNRRFAHGDRDPVPKRKYATYCRRQYAN